jgi:hypothetical protein
MQKKILRDITESNFPFSISIPLKVNNLVDIIRFYEPFNRRFANVHLPRRFERVRKFTRNYTDASDEKKEEENMELGLENTKKNSVGSSTNFTLH